MHLKLLHSGRTVEIKEVGSFNPKPYVRDVLIAGETGYMTANIKSPKDVKIGDTLTDPRHPSPPLPGFQEIHPMVFSAAFTRSTRPISSISSPRSKSSSSTTRRSSSRRRRPSPWGLVFAAASSGCSTWKSSRNGSAGSMGWTSSRPTRRVVYRVTLADGAVKEIDNPAFLPEVARIEAIEEPMVKSFVITPNEYIGDLMNLISEKRGTIEHTETLDTRRVMLTCRIPLNEILIDFHDRIKSITRGYGSMDYEPTDYELSDMVKLDMLVNAESVDAFSCIVHRSKAEGRGRALAAKLKEVIPRQQYQVAIQAAIGGKIVARENISALRKDVTAKCYGGDISRKRKLLEKQKEGKKRMKAIGSVNIPQEAFIQVLRT